MLRGFSGADDSNAFTSLRVGHNQNSFDARHSDCDEALLGTGMIRVRIRQRQGITIYRGGLLKRYPVLAAIASGFGRVPFKVHNLSLLHFFASIGKYIATIRGAQHFVVEQLSQSNPIPAGVTRDW